jgi:hypothetical protein
MSKELPILFSGPMVRAILEGRKTQTRRLVKMDPDVAERLKTAGPPEVSHAPAEWNSKYGTRARWSLLSKFGNPEGMNAWCPYGNPGDRLYVRETWGAPVDGCEFQGGVSYRADHVDPRGDGPANPMKWKPSIHMPRWASRIELEVTGVRVERLQDISEADARAEGVDAHAPLILPGEDDADREDPREVGYPAPGSFARQNFQKLWDSLNADRAPWASNPWVWVIEFRRIKP